MEIEAMIAVLQAALAGAEIEKRSMSASTSGRWFPKPQLAPWDFVNWEYREKPKPREWVAVLISRGAYRGALFDSEENARSYGYSGPFIRVREVLP